MLFIQKHARLHGMQCKVCTTTQEDKTREMEKGTIETIEPRRASIYKADMC